MLRGESRRLRVLTYRWHVPHQYEPYKLGHDLATSLKTMRDPARLAAMSAAARSKALDVSNHDRYLGAWDALLREMA